MREWRRARDVRERVGGDLFVVPGDDSELRRLRKLAPVLLLLDVGQQAQVFAKRSDSTHEVVRRLEPGGASCVC